jgi:hypothetical protein
MVWKNSSRFCGFWLNGNRHGFGILNVIIVANETYSHNSSYHGNWQHNKMDGFGIHEDIFQTGSESISLSHEGFFKDNLKHGLGATITPFYNHFGEFYGGKEHGYGLMTNKMDLMKTITPYWEGIYSKGTPYLGLTKQPLGVSIHNFKKPAQELKIQTDQNLELKKSPDLF